MLLRKAIKITLLIPVLTVYFSFVVIAQRITVKATLEPKTITIGDWIYFRIEATFPNNTRVLWPLIPDSFGNFEVISRSAIDSVSKDGNITKKQLITLTTFDSGSHRFPSFGIPFGTMKDKSLNSVYTDSFEVTVSNVKVDTSKSLRPIKAPMKMPLKLRELIPYILVFFGIIFIAFLIFYFFSKRHIRPVLFQPKPKFPLHVVAFEKLKKLEDRKYWQKGEVKRYHTELTDIIREYIELRFEIPALESITEEIIRDLGSAGPDNELLSQLRWFLELSDLVKFAKLNPLPDENERCMKISYDFILKTVPQEIIPEKKPDALKNA
jgi:hypothetical protein